MMGVAAQSDRACRAPTSVRSPRPQGYLAGAPGPPRVITPWAVRRQSHEQIIEEKLGAIFHCESRKSVRAGALASSAAQLNMRRGR
jgi:hypothetical protein